MHLPRYLLSAGLLTSTTVASNSSKTNGSASAPVAIVKNGTYYGLHNGHYYMDYFLGIPYAQPPIGDLRYQVPQSVNETWREPRNATEYGYACIGYGEYSQIAAHNYVNEDCLTLNVYRPAGYRNAHSLPVLVWIHGGGFYEGAALDQRYNLTFMVEESVNINKPIVAVSLNYRLSGWGFLFSGEMLEAGVTNLGIRDQRLALHWVQENIVAFGGDPTKVTIWGESAGGASVGVHLLAYNGRNDSLFRSAIAQSGAASGFGYLRGNATVAETGFADLVQSVGCAEAINKIACLRTLPMETLNDYYNNSATSSYLPTPDGDIIACSFESQLQDGSFVKVPYLVGTNADEGTGFASFGDDTNNDTVNSLLAYGVPSTLIPSLMERYPLNGTDQVLQSHPTAFNSTIGLQWKRISTLLTDILMVAPTRLTIQQMLRHTNTSIYHYNFNTIPNGVPDVWSVTHFMEFAFVVHNTEGIGYLNLDPPYLGPNPFGGMPQSYYDLTDTMCRMWISFVNHGTPNYGINNVPFWLPYTLEGRETIYFDANTTPYAGTDTYREVGTNFIIQDLLTRY